MICGIPVFLNHDNEREFITEAVKKWLSDSGVCILYFKPGSPLDNDCIESIVERFEEGLLKSEWFENVYL